MDVAQVTEALRTSLHFVTVHRAGPMRTMPVICTVCGLLEVVPREDFPGEYEQFVYAREKCREHAWLSRTGGLR